MQSFKEANQVLAARIEDSNEAEPQPQASKYVLDMTPPDAVATNSPGTPLPVIPADIVIKGARSIPHGFKEMNAVEAIGIEVPSHIQARWKTIDPDMRVEQLFSTGHRATTTLEGVKIKCLQEHTGQTEYKLVPVKTGKKVAPHLGLVELFAKLGIKGRTVRAQTKGLMFFFLACADPDSVMWPDFKPATASKRERAPAFSLAEQGRLVGIISDPQNMELTTMFMKKWDRAELDAKAGAKGINHYWNQLAVIFNDATYFPAPTDAFANHVAILDDDYVYSTDLVPVYRCGEYLKEKWAKLRALYSLFQGRYERSGHNEPDPTKYTNDLPTLLMHWTFHSTPLEAWAAKTIEPGAEIDDAGDGASSGRSVRKRNKTSKGVVTNDVTNATSHSQRILAGTAVYETLHTVQAMIKGEDEKKLHQERVRRVDLIMDKFLTELERDLE